MSLVVICIVLSLSVSFGRADDKTECGRPPLVSNTEVDVDDKDKHPVGTVVRYTCEFGYVLSGYPRTTTCQYVEETDTAEWTKPNFHCAPRSCGDPGFVSHAHRNGSVFTFPSKVTYACDEGYVLVGSPQRFCQTSGQWSGSLPSCKRIQCETPPNPENGRVVYETLEYGAELRYECNRGYVLKASDQRICLETGLWSGKEPECLENHCEYPRAPLHGTMDLVGGKTTAGSIVLYSCSDGYKPYGSITSKCLSTGDWTFPPPLCLEPCQVPEVAHGSLGVFEEKRYRRKTFKQLQVGSVIEDGKEMYLRCSQKYEPGGSSSVSEVKVTCSKGKWSSELICKPAACRTRPPIVPNAYLDTTERDHGTVLTYRCNKDYVKSVYGSTTCDFGVWIGKQPVCKDSRCYTTSLKFSGLSQNGKKIFKHNEVFIPQCIGGYEVSKPGDHKLTCANSVWEGQLPPCKPAKCKELPNAPRNGRIVNFTGDHGSTARITCNTWYQLYPPDAALKCSFGEWNSVVDACRDTRCYVKDLKEYEGVDISDAEPTLPGDFGNITCRKGYVFMHAKQPQCSNGIWQLPNSASPCQPGPCSVHYVRHGQLRKINRYSRYNWRRVRYDTITEYLKEKIGTAYDHGSELYLSCEKPYIFQGRDSASIINVRCIKQEWIPRPVCLLPGESLPVETTTLEPEHVSLLGSNQVASVNESFITKSQASTFTSVVTHSDEIEPSQSVEEVTLIPDSLLENNTVNFTVTENPVVRNGRNCSCIYNLDDEDVVAYVGTERLQFNSEVKQGCTIQFSCRYIGYHRFVGNSELQCSNCIWHSSQFPMCAKPRKGDAIMSVTVTDKNLLSVTPTGVIRVPKGTTLTISCTIKDSEVWPSFLNLTYEVQPSYRYEAVQTQGYLYMADLLLRNVDSSFSRKYECGSTDGHSNYIEIEVTGQKCPAIVSDSIAVTYSNEQEIHSKARFRCLDEKKVLNGTQEVTCLSTGMWSDKLPSCQYVGCTALETPPELTVFYSNGSRVNSQAVFECNKPYVLQGASIITCLANGKWSDEMPICSPVFCSMQSLMVELPENLAPRIEDVTGPEMPYGSILTLECVLERLFILGPPNVTCSKDGVWSVGNVMCVQGCPSLQIPEGSNLVIHPIKEFYRFGEFLTFLCPPGLALSSDLERMVCLRDGWSEQDIPSCSE